MFMSSIRAQLLTGGVVLAMAGLTGCANLEAIQQFGKLSADSAGYTKLTDDYVSTFDRRKAWTFKDNADELAKLEADAVGRRQQGVELKVYHMAISDYMDALADLAADDVPSYDKELGGLIDQAVKLKAIDGGNAAAAKSIAGLIAEAATNFYRQRKLKEVIANANEPLQKILARMQFFVEQYERTAQTEKDAFDAYYLSLEDLAKKGNERMFSQYAWAMNSELSPAHEEKIKAAKKYLETLKKIAEAHQSLFDNLSKISDKEFQSQLKKYTKAIYAAYKATREPAK